MATDTDEIYREANARYHRLLAHYFAVYAWSRKVDCIIITRDQILRFLKLKAIKQTRISWFENDVRPWFPETSVMRANGADKVHSIVLSRHVLPESVGEIMMTETRIERLRADGIAAEIFLDGRADDSMPGEEEIISSMSLVASGLDVLSAIPGLQAASE